jgi:sensor histidine kinase regulating citrate/malate metabolism
LKKHGEKIFMMRKTFHEHPQSKGMGLYLVRVQVEAIGGKVNVQSKPGEGTVFSVRLNKNISL